MFTLKKYLISSFFCCSFMIYQKYELSHWKTKEKKNPNSLFYKSEQQASWMLQPWHVHKFKCNLNILYFNSFFNGFFWNELFQLISETPTFQTCWTGSNLCAHGENALPTIGQQVAEQQVRSQQRVMSWDRWNYNSRFLCHIGAISYF